ncbi:MAG: DNA polymerase III subunit beta [Lentisphaeria bacterium]|nr:DNA polymerase III subunit beta [Candidatus Neomarinimicrobiota bacterium]MCF7841292.1 DNA polymerase III subunit beta [Lentisphaeria bacterium]
MQFTLEKSALQTGVQKIIKVSPTRSTMPILNHILFTIENGRLYLRTSDIEITYVLEVDLLNGEDGSVAIPARLLQEITNELPETELKFSVDEKQRISLETTVGTYKIQGRPGDEFPETPELADASTFKLPADLLERMVDKTLFAVGRDELKPALMGVLFEINKADIRAVATDGHRLVRFTNKAFTNSGDPAKVIIPTKFLQLLQNLLPMEDQVEFSISNDHVKVETKGAKVYTRVIDEHYPDYTAVIPSGNDKTFVSNTSEMVNTARRVSIFSNRTTHQLAFKLHPGYLEVYTEDPENSTSAKEEVLVEYDGEEMTIGYNSLYVRDLLRNIETEKVVFKLSSAVGPGIILPEKQREKEDLLMLLMPIRLNA